MSRAPSDPSEPIRSKPAPARRRGRTRIADLVEQAMRRAEAAVGDGDPADAERWLKVARAASALDAEGDAPPSLAERRAERAALLDRLAGRLEGLVATVDASAQRPEADEDAAPGA